MPTVTVDLPDRGEEDWDLKLATVFNQILAAMTGIDSTFATVSALNSVNSTATNAQTSATNASNAATAANTLATQAKNIANGSIQIRLWNPSTRVWQAKNAPAGYTGNYWWLAVTDATATTPPESVDGDLLFIKEA